MGIKLIKIGIIGLALAVSACKNPDDRFAHSGVNYSAQ